MDERFIDACEDDNLALVKSMAPSADTTSISFGLCWAAMYGHCDIVIYLVSIGADFKGYGGDGLPIRWASMNGHLPVVQYLLSLGAAISSDDVSFAADKGHFEVVKCIMETTGVGPTVMSEKCQAYFAFCKRMATQKQVRAQRTIYFWWIPICYDMTRECGKRMAVKNLQVYEQLILSNM